MLAWSGASDSGQGTCAVSRLGNNTFVDLKAMVPEDGER